MVRTSTTRSDEQTPAPPARAARDWGRGRGRGGARATARAPTREATEKPLVAPVGQALEAGGGAQTPIAHTLEQQVHVVQVLGFMPAQPIIVVQPKVRPVASEEEQRRVERFKKYDPPTFSGIVLEDSHGFLYQWQRILCAMGIMEGFSSIAAPLTRLNKKGALFRWSDECEESFQKLKTAFYNSSSRFCLQDREGRVIAYASHQLKPHQKNYPVHNLELASIVHTLKNWRHYLYGMSCEAFTYHKSLQHLFKQKDLNLRKHIWLELLKDYDITILYHLSKANMVGDALNRKVKSMSSLAFIPIGERTLTLDVQALAIRFVRLDILEPSRARQYDDLHLLVLKDTVQHGDANEVTISDDGVLRK
ncbi:uncharacterized protein [Nicotiana tomentosiformis]|uniref:uncharacterized protein n=1 Tax=Nicotiana tomentosiformis TaxID=4098 RepID=UPI00388C7526